MRKISACSPFSRCLKKATLVRGESTLGAHSQRTGGTCPCCPRARSHSQVRLLPKTKQKSPRSWSRKVTVVFELTVFVERLAWVNCVPRRLLHCTVELLHDTCFSTEAMAVGQSRQPCQVSWHLSHLHWGPRQMQVSLLAMPPIGVFGGFRFSLGSGLSSGSFWRTWLF